MTPKVPKIQGFSAGFMPNGAAPMPATPACLVPVGTKPAIHPIPHFPSHSVSTRREGQIASPLTPLRPCAPCAGHGPIHLATPNQKGRIAPLTIRYRKACRTVAQLSQGLNTDYPLHPLGRALCYLPPPPLPIIFICLRHRVALPAGSRPKTRQACGTPGRRPRRAS